MGGRDGAGGGEEVDWKVGVIVESEDYLKLTAPLSGREELCCFIDA